MTRTRRPSGAQPRDDAVAGNPGHEVGKPGSVVVGRDEGENAWQRLLHVGGRLRVGRGAAGKRCTLDLVNRGQMMSERLSQHRIVGGAARLARHGGDQQQLATGDREGRRSGDVDEQGVCSLVDCGPSSQWCRYRHRTRIRSPLRQRRCAAEGEQRASTGVVSHENASPSRSSSRGAVRQPPPATPRVSRRPEPGVAQPDRAASTCSPVLVPAASPRPGALPGQRRRSRRRRGWVESVPVSRRTGALMMAWSGNGLMLCVTAGRRGCRSPGSPWHQGRRARPSPCSCLPSARGRARRPTRDRAVERWSATRCLE